VLFWRNACVGYSLQKNASKRVTLAQARAAASAAFDTWMGVQCPTSGGKTGKVSITVEELIPVQCGVSGGTSFQEGKPSQNVIVFRDTAWPHNDAKDPVGRSLTVALTTATFNNDTGELWDADIEMNSHDYVFTTDGDPEPGEFDLQAVLTHEGGHFLGIGHSSDPYATMRTDDPGGSDRRRDLAPDDISGICAAYPPGGVRSVDKSVDSSGRIVQTTCNPTPVYGFSSACTADGSGDSGGCACRATPRVPQRNLDIFLGLTWLAALRRIFRKHRDPCQAHHR
jgi:hypothetical protein